MKLPWLCGCRCGAVKTFEDATTVTQNVSTGVPKGTSGDASGPPADALLLVFQRLPARELYGVVTAVSKPWQAAATAVFSIHLISIDGLKQGSSKTASVIAWLKRYSKHIQDVCIHHADISPEEWTALLALPYPNLSKLELRRSRIYSAELSLLTQLTSLKQLTLCTLGAPLDSSFVQQLGTSLTRLTKLELKSCGIGGEHLAGLTPLVQDSLQSLDLFDNAAIGADPDSSNNALVLWSTRCSTSSQLSKATVNQVQQEIVPAARAAAVVEQSPAAEAAGVADQPPNSSNLDAAAAATALSTEMVHVEVSNAVASDSNGQAANEFPPQEQQQKGSRMAPLQLKQLRLSYCQVRHLPALAQLTSLTSLDLSQNQCDAETVEAIGQLQQLRELALEEGVARGISPEAFAALSGLSNLEMLNISGGPPGCLEMLLSTVPAVKHAAVPTAASPKGPSDGDSKMTASAPATGCPLPSLRRLEAEQLGLTDADIAALVRSCSQLQDLNISNNHAGPNGIAKLNELAALTHLNISKQQPALADAAVVQLLQLRNLKGLDVGGNSFTKTAEVQLQREGSGAGGHLARLTGCGMREEVHEPWVRVSMDRQQRQQLERKSNGADSPTRGVRTTSMPLDGSKGSPKSSRFASEAGGDSPRRKGSMDSPRVHRMGSAGQVA